MTSNNAFAARTGIVGVVVMNESNMTSYFPEAGNLKGSNADIFSDVTGPSSHGLDDCLSFQIGLDPVLLLFPPLLGLLGAILDLHMTSTPILPFGAFYLIMHKVY